MLKTMFAGSWPYQAFKTLTFGLGRRLVLVFGLLLSVFGATAIFINLQTQVELIQQRLDARIDHLGKLVVDMTASHLYEMRLSDLEIIYEDLERQSDIAYVYVVDENSIELAAGDIDNELTFLEVVEDELVDKVRETGQMLRNSDLETEHVGIPVILGTEHLGIVRFGIDLDDYNRNLGTVWSRNLIAGLLFVFTGIILSTLIARRLTKPLDSLIAMTDRASKGELDQSIDLHTNDEFEHLASSFNTMLDSLRRSMKEVHQLAYQDQLTSLPNRAWFQEYLQRLIADAKRQDSIAALVFLDLDRFKHVNDTLGHHVGDQLLAAFGERLQGCIRQADVLAVYRATLVPGQATDEASTAAVARLGGDEFTIVLSHLSKAQDAAIIAERIVASMAEPFDLGGEAFVASTSIGIAVCPTDGDNPEDLLKHADAAMYQAKQAGRNTYRFYDAAIAQIAIQRISLERELRRAIKENQFRLLFQSQHSVATGDVVAAEALIRWQHSDAGLLTPDHFIPVAEEAGLMPDLGRLVIRSALYQALEWSLVRERPLRLAINISMDELEAADFAQWVLEQIEETAFDPHYLEFEVTERTAMFDSDRVEEQVKRLRSAGVRFAVDDFGIGYSNLARLMRLEFQTLKIDQSLMRNVGLDQDAEILVTSILNMARSLNFDVVAEGIETKEQLAFLAQNACDYAQGYLLSRPMSEGAFKRWIREDRIIELEAPSSLVAS